MEASRPPGRASQHCGEQVTRVSQMVQAAMFWDGVYDRTGAVAVSWFQRQPAVSLELIDRLQVAPRSSVLDVGGGASGLTSALVRRGFRDVTVVDVSKSALAAGRQRLGSARPGVRFVQHDLLTWEPQRRYDLWHDRAMLHFFVEPTQRARYVDVLTSAVVAGGGVIIGVFAEDGPERCSGLPVMRYSSHQIARLLGEGFALVDDRLERHTTPAGVVQSFQWVALRRC